MIIQREKLRKFFDSRRRLEGFLAHKDTPGIIIENEREIFHERVMELRKDGIDVISKSPAIEIAYLEFIAEYMHNENLMDRCGRCSNYVGFDNAEGESINWTCQEHTDLPMKCDQFNDTGYDLMERLSKFCINRCETCNHIIVTSMGDPINGVYHENDVCELKCNRVATICPEYKEKKDPDYTIE